LSHSPLDLEGHGSVRLPSSNEVPHLRRQASFQADKACIDRRIIIFSALQADYKRQHWTVSQNILRL